MMWRHFSTGCSNISNTWSIGSTSSTANCDNSLPSNWICDRRPWLGEMSIGSLSYQSQCECDDDGNHMDVLTFQSTRSLGLIPLRMPFLPSSLMSFFNSPISMSVGALIMKDISLPLTRHQSTQTPLSAMADWRGGWMDDVCFPRLFTFSIAFWQSVMVAKWGRKWRKFEMRESKRICWDADWTNTESYVLIYL